MPRSILRTSPTMLCLLIIFLLHIYAAAANTEKVIFMGPSGLRVPTEHPTLEDLQLEALSPQLWSLRKRIKADFPSNAFKNGHSSWMILHGLKEGQRYEVRVCWAATEPTSFRLDTYTLPTVFETPELITSLARYSESRQTGSLENGHSDSFIPRESTFDDVSSTLFLHIQAAADYYTMNHTLMKDPPPVLVDIILDPFILNIFPRSLIPTAAYIVILAIGGFYLSKYVNVWIRIMALNSVGSEKKDS